MGLGARRVPPAVPVAVQGQKVAAAMLAMEGSLVSMTGMLMALGLPLKVGHLEPCPRFNTDGPCGFGARFPTDVLLVTGVFTVSTVLLVSSWKLLHGGRVGWIVALLSQGVVIGFVAPESAGFGSVATVTAVAVAVLALAGLALSGRAVFGGRAREAGLP